MRVWLQTHLHNIIMIIKPPIRLHMHTHTHSHTTSLEYHYLVRQTSASFSITLFHFLCCSGLYEALRLPAADLETADWSLFSGHANEKALIPDYLWPFPRWNADPWLTVNPRSGESQRDSGQTSRPRPRGCLLIRFKGKNTREVVCMCVFVQRDREREKKVSPGWQSCADGV